MRVDIASKKEEQDVIFFKKGNNLSEKALKNLNTAEIKNLNV